MDRFAHRYGYVYFVGCVFAGISTLSTCSNIWVPESSLTLSVLDTITGPGVLALGSVLRLRPLSPKTPCGMPILMGLPVAAVSRRAAELSTCVEGDSFTVMGAWNVASDALAAPAPLPPPPALRFEADEFPPRPVGAAGPSRGTPTIDGGSICDGSSTRDLLTTGWDIAWTIASKSMSWKCFNKMRSNTIPRRDSGCVLSLALTSVTCPTSLVSTGMII